MLVNDFIKKFKYKSTIPFIFGWRRIDEAPYEGVCQDFALTVLYCIEGSWFKVLWSLLTFKAVFWLVKSPVNGIVPRHIVLWHRDHGWIDSTNREWRDTPTPHKLRVPLLFPWAYFRILWGGIVKFLF